MSLLAVHISDGVLATGVWSGGFIIAGLLLVASLYRFADDEVPRIALLTAAFFVASSIHVRVGPTSVHLLLNALVGLILGRRAPLSIAVGLTMQACLLGHGGFTTLGVNMVVIAIPALCARPMYRCLTMISRRRYEWWAGFATGLVVVLWTATLNVAVLILGGTEDWTVIAVPQFIAYSALGLIEGLILGTTVGFLKKVKPELLR